MTAPMMMQQPSQSVVPMQSIALDDDNEAEAVQRREAALRVLYGSDFPLLVPESAGDHGIWASWARKKWASREAAMTYALWIADRNRDFWAGRQWLDSTGPGRKWVVPRAPTGAVRQVVNVTKAALNLRAQIVSEQRPGYKIEPTNRDSQSKKKAEAKQLALDYAWKACQLESIHAEISRWCGTDGCAFVETYWDEQAGPWYELTQITEGQQIRLGDVRKCVLRIDEVRVAPNATATVPPDWFCIRRVVPTGEAVGRWGESVAGQASEQGENGGADQWNDGVYTTAGRQDDRFLDTPTLEEFTVYLDRGDYLPKGLEVHIVGEVVTYLGPLLFGIVPVARYTDGSKDPAYYPEPEMNNWVDDQVAINQVVSKMIETVRKTAGGAYLARPQTITSETKMLGGVSLIEVQGTGALDDVVKYIPPATVGADALGLLQFHMQQFEQKSGWNDATRGSFKADTSGRAILAIREQVERTFAPMVQAFARGTVEDAKITLAAMAWGYDLPREVAITGKSRIDLARLISAEDLDGVSDVEVDPRTLMPMPESLRLMMLEKDFAMGLLSPDQYLRLRKTANYNEVGVGDEDDRARANRIADMIRRGIPAQQLPPTLPMDNALVHMDILRREILLDDDLPIPVRAVAFDRFMWYQMLSMQQMAPAGAPPAPGGPGGAPAPGGSGGMPGMDPRTQPLLSQRSGIPAGPLGLDPSEEVSAGPAADARAPY